MVASGELTNLERRFISKLLPANDTDKGLLGENISKARQLCFISKASQAKLEKYAL